MSPKILSKKRLPDCFFILLLNRILISFYEGLEGLQMISQGRALKGFAVNFPLMVAHEYERDT